MDKQINYEINITKLLKAFWHRAWLIILLAVIFAGMFFSYAKFGITPLYETETLLYVNNSDMSLGNVSFKITSSDLAAAKYLVGTYIVILNSRLTLQEVIDKADLDCSYEQLKAMISASAVDETEIFRITVNHPDPMTAELIANTIADVLPNKISDVLEGSSARVVDYAVTPNQKASPSITKYTALGMILGALIGCTIITCIELADTLIRDEEYIIESYEIPVISIVPNFNSGKKSSYYKYKYEYSSNAKRRGK